VLSVDAATPGTVKLGSFSRVRAVVYVDDALVLEHEYEEEDGTCTILDSKEACVFLDAGPHPVEVQLLTDAGRPCDSPPCSAVSASQFNSGSKFTVVFSQVALTSSTPATVVSLNSSVFPSSDELQATSIVIGKPWKPTITLGFPRRCGTWQLYFGTTLIAPPAGAAVPQFTSGLNFGSSKNGRMLLCNINTMGPSFTGTHDGTTAAPVTWLVPCDPVLVGNTWCAQALVFGAVTGNGGGNARLTSAASGIIGTH
jgi:hypothetical protein